MNAKIVEADLFLELGTAQFLLSYMLKGYTACGAEARERRGEEAYLNSIATFSQTASTGKHACDLKHWSYCVTVYDKDVLMQESL